MLLSQNFPDCNKVHWHFEVKSSTTSWLSECKSTSSIARDGLCVYPRQFLTFYFFAEESDWIMIPLRIVEPPLTTRVVQLGHRSCCLWCQWDVIYSAEVLGSGLVLRDFRMYGRILSVGKKIIFHAGNIYWESSDEGQIDISGSIFRVFIVM